MTAPIGRTITAQYADPLDLVWIRAAERLGMHVERSPSVYASWDGCSRLTLASCDLDPDDSLAQLIFHEICHYLVAEPEKRRLPDYGLDNTSDRDLVYEHACHRLQAALAGAYGLRDFFAVTTQWRPYWDALPRDPLADDGDPAVPIARRARAEADRPPFAEVLSDALARTAAIADVVRPIAPADSLFARTRARHPSGFLMHDDPERSCDACAWSFAQGASGLGCRQAERSGRRGVRLARGTRACDRFETRLTAESCAVCGACCREGFDRVEVRPRDLVRRRHPELVAEDSWGVFIPRPAGRCAALTGDGSRAPYRCSIYAERPAACREFAIGGAACLEARRRTGLSP